MVKNDAASITGRAVLFAAQEDLIVGMKKKPPRHKIFSNKELQAALPRSRLEALSLARFGGVMISEAVYSGARKVDIMFREKPDPNLPFSGWVFLSSSEPAHASPEKRGLKLHDCLAILRVAPEVAAYLDLPPGTHLMRTGKDRFAEFSDY